MKKANVYFLAKCALFVAESARKDENGLDPVILTPIGGQAPRSRVIVSGTIAQSEGFVPGNVYLCMGSFREVVETEDGERVESYNYTNIAHYTDGEKIIDYVMSHPLEEPLIAPSTSTGDSDTIRIVKGNPKARRIRETEEEEKTAKPEKKKRTA